MYTNKKKLNSSVFFLAKPIKKNKRLCEVNVNLELLDMYSCLRNIAKLKFDERERREEENS
jgi:hypothetical protein